MTTGPKGGADLGRPRPVRLYLAGLRNLRTPIIGPVHQVVREAGIVPKDPQQPVGQALSLPLLQGRLVGNAATVEGVDGVQEFVQQGEAHVFRM